MKQGISIHIGLNRLDEKHYLGKHGILKCAENDAREMQKIAGKMGYAKTDLLLTEDATIRTVTSKIKNAANLLQTGDILLLTFSGHGGYIPDKDNEEKEGFDETWCLYDGQLIDDLLYDIWTNFSPGVRILVISDSCHSGTIIKIRNNMPQFLKFYKNVTPKNDFPMRCLPPEIADQVYQQNKEFYEEEKKKIHHVKGKVNAAVLSLTACQDNQGTQYGDQNGKFTEALLKVWENGNFKGNYRSFHWKIMSMRPPNESPNLFAIGENTDDFLAQRPFEI